MAQVTVEVKFDQASGSVGFYLDLQGNSELEHELLVAAIGSGRSVSISPAHKADELFAEFTIKDTNIWPNALHNLENRRRIADGKPTIEEEKAAADAQAKAQEAVAKAAEEAAKQPTAEEKMEAAIAGGIAKGLKAAGVAPKS